MILLSSALGSFIQLLGVLIIFLFVLAITYFTTKWIGNYQKTNFANKNLQIVESICVTLCGPEGRKCNSGLLRFAVL